MRLILLLVFVLFLMSFFWTVQRLLLDYLGESRKLDRGELKKAGIMFIVLAVLRIIMNSV